MKGKGLRKRAAGQVHENIQREIYGIPRFPKAGPEGNHAITEWHQEAEEEFGVQLSAEEQAIQLTLEDGFVC